MSRSKMKPPLLRLLLLLLLLVVGYASCASKEEGEGGKNEDQEQGKFAVSGIIKPELNKGNQEGSNSEGGPAGQLSRGHQTHRYKRDLDSDESDPYDSDESGYNTDGERDDEDDENNSNDDQDVEEVFDEPIRRKPPKGLRNKEYEWRKQGRPTWKKRIRNNRRKPLARLLKQKLIKSNRTRRDVGSHDIVKRGGRFKAAVDKVQKKLSDLRRNRDQEYERLINDSPDSVESQESSTIVPQEYGNEEENGEPSSTMTWNKVRGKFRGAQKKFSDLTNKFEKRIRDKFIDGPTNSMISESETYEPFDEDIREEDWTYNPIYEEPNPRITWKEKVRGKLRGAPKKISDLKNKFKKRIRNKKYIDDPTNFTVPGSGRYEPVPVNITENDWIYNPFYIRPPSNMTQEERSNFIGTTSDDKDKRGLGKKIKNWIKKMKERKKKTKDNKKYKKEEYDRGDDDSEDNGRDNFGYDNDDDGYDGYVDYNQDTRERYKRGEVNLMERVLRSMAVFTSRLLDEGKDTTITTTLDTKEKGMSEEPPEEDVQEGEEYENETPDESDEESDEYTVQEDYNS